MQDGMVSILSDILAHKKQEVAEWKKARPLEILEQDAAEKPAPPPFAAALLAAPIGLIAEVKRRSPSAGALREPFEPAAIAKAYQKAGAQAVSVLMDQKYFAGGEEAFRAARAAVGLPLLYKEFVVDPWQIWHARTLGASAVLLIVAALRDAELTRFLGEARAAGLEALVEVHNEIELERAADAGARCIGVNNRNLMNFTVHLAVTERLRPLAPPDCTFVSESGIRRPADVTRLLEAGVNAILVGEQLLRQPDLEIAVADLMSEVW